MIRYAEALERLLGASAERSPLSEERVPLSSACGRVAAVNIFSAEPLPAFDNSSMDGFAVRARETRRASPENPVKLRIAGEISAGDDPKKMRISRQMHSYAIMTGAPIPSGCDSVIKVEDVRTLEGGRVIEIKSPAEKGDYIRRVGYDFKAGMRIASAGTLIDERHVLACAALGVTRIRVRRRPKVAVISTGKELVSPETKPGSGKIRNATGSYLQQALRRLGVKVKFCGTVKDDAVGFKRKVERLLKEDPDIIVTTGAVSKGLHDFVTDSVREMGADPLFHNVAIRPGKPGLAARFRDGPIFFGMPGNPISTVVALRFFLVPVLRRLLGREQECPIKLATTEAIQKPDGLRCFFKAVTERSSAGHRVCILPGQGSFQIRPLLDADAWAVLPEEGDRIAAGAQVETFTMMPDRLA